MNNLEAVLFAVSEIKFGPDILEGLIITLFGICLIVYDQLDKHVKHIPPFNKMIVYQSGKERGETELFHSPIKSDSRLEVKLNGNVEQIYDISLLKVIVTYEGMHRRSFNNSTGQKYAMKGNEKRLIQLNTDTEYRLSIHANPFDDLIPIPDIEYRIIEYKQPNDKIFIMGSTFLGVGIGILI
ncbi:MAG: hypothetical protein AB9861_02680 [Methanosarcina sp.]